MYNLELPDFQATHRLMVASQNYSHLFVNHVASYKDYIVCFEISCIYFWKSSIDNLDQLQFDLQHHSECE